VAKGIRTARTAVVAAR
jgi:hypothetical protein